MGGVRDGKGNRHTDSADSTGSQNLVALSQCVAFKSPPVVEMVQASSPYRQRLPYASRPSQAEAKQFNDLVRPCL